MQPLVPFYSKRILNWIGTDNFKFIKLKSISFPDSLITIGEYAFRKSKLEEISIGTGCTSISITAFTGCEQLLRVNVAEKNSKYKTEHETLATKDGLTIIFVPLNIEKIKILGTVTTIGKTMLQSCKNLKSIEFDGVSNTFDAEGGVLYSKGFTTLIAVCGGITEVTAHKNTIKIDGYAANGCTNLTTFKFSGSAITTIGIFSFAASGLTSFDIPKSVTTVGQYCFDECRSLKTLTMDIDSPITLIPEYFAHQADIREFTLGRNVLQIDIGGFYAASLKSITFPDDSKLESIGPFAFERT